MEYINIFSLYMTILKLFFFFFSKHFNKVKIIDHYTRHFNVFNSRNKMGEEYLTCSKNANYLVKK